MPAQLPRVPKAEKTTTTTPTPDRALGSLVTLATLTDSDMEEGVPKESQSEEINQKKLHAMMMKFIKANGPKEDFRYTHMKTEEAKNFDFKHVGQNSL